jgi:hypothetical protein
MVAQPGNGVSEYPDADRKSIFPDFAPVAMPIENSYNRLREEAVPRLPETPNIPS